MAWADPQKGISWRKANPEYFRRWALKNLYGITLEDYDQRLDRQGGGCAICGAEPWTQKHGRLHVDHDHKTSEVRGLLCFDCNVALGAFKDNQTRLLRAISYLKGIL